MPGPREAPAIWDYVVIGTTVLPPDGVEGHVVVTGTAKIKSDKKKPSGANGGRNTTQGLDLTKLKIKLVWNDAAGRYDRVADAIQAIWPPRGAQGFAHGGTDLINLRDVEVESVTLPEFDEGKGSLEIEVTEWLPPAAKAVGGGGTATPANFAALQAEYEKIKAEVQLNIQLGNGDSPAVKAKIERMKQLSAQLQNANSATKTSTSSTPTKQFAKGNGQGVPLGEVQPNTPPSVPLGEIQP